MDRATFFKHFDLLADQPDAVAKMRELVLQLAIRGQVTARVASEQKDNAWQKFLKSVSGDLNEADPSPFGIPKDWRWARLDAVADYRAARKVEPSEISGKDWVLDLEEIEKDTGRLLRLTSFNEKQSSSNKAEFLPGDVLYGKLRPYLNKVLVAPKPGFCTTEIVPIRSRGMIVPTYLCLFLRSPHFVAYTNAKSYGMKMPRLGTEDAIRAWIAVPPPAEQRRIVAKVEELMALCDELAARQQARHVARAQLQQSALHHLLAAREPRTFAPAWQRVRDHFHLLHDTPDAIPQLRQAILQLAVQGRLVPQNSNDGQAGVPPAKQEIAAPLDASSHWRWFQFEDVMSYGPVNGLSLKPVASETSTRALTLTATTSGKFRDDCFKYIDQQIPLDSELWLRSGDILIQRGNSIDYVGVAAVYTGEEHQFIYPDLMIKVRVDDYAIPAFAHLVLNSPFGRTFFRSRATGTSGSMPKINHTVVKSFPFPLPPLAEQKRIVARVEALLRQCDALEAQLHQTRTLGAHLLDSTLRSLLAS